MVAVPAGKVMVLCSSPEEIKVVTIKFNEM
jgi:hypothetical protein